MPIVTPIETCPNAGGDKADTASAAPRNQFAFMSFLSWPSAVPVFP